MTRKTMENPRMQAVRAELEALAQEIASWGSEAPAEQMAAEDSADDLRAQIADLEAQLAQAKKERDQNADLIQIIKSDNKRHQTEEMNCLGRDLAKELADFEDATDMEMTLDLGENMRDQLRDVFGILEQYAILPVAKRTPNPVASNLGTTLTILTPGETGTAKRDFGGTPIPARA